MTNQHPQDDARHDDELHVQAEGDDAFAGTVGDDLPGRDTSSHPGSDSDTGSVGDAGRDADSTPDPRAEPDQPSARTEPTDGRAVADADPQDAGRAAEEQAQEAREAGEHPDTVLAAERLADLQRLQAEYVNYKKRVDRDRATHRELGAGGVLEALMPVLDEIELARRHGDLTEGTPFASIATKLEEILGRQGLARYGEPGEPFDPNQHEALMNVEAELPQEATTTTVVQVLQPGYRLAGRVLRPARVSVADPS